MYCIYVSNNGTNIQKVIDNNNQVVSSNMIQPLMDYAKEIKARYPYLNVSIVDEELNSIEVDYQ